MSFSCSGFSIENVWEKRNKLKIQITRNFVNFLRGQNFQFCKISANFHGFFSESHNFLRILMLVMLGLQYSSEFWRKTWKTIYPFFWSFQIVFWNFAENLFKINENMVPYASVKWASLIFFQIVISAVDERLRREKIILLGPRFLLCRFWSLLPSLSLTSP